MLPADPTARAYDIDPDDLVDSGLDVDFGDGDPDSGGDLGGGGGEIRGGGILHDDAGGLDELDRDRADHPLPAGGLPAPARRALATLLQERFVTRTGDPQTWSVLVTYQDDLRARLADLYLELIVDDDYGVAYKRQSDNPDAPVMLRRERPLTRPTTLVLLLLRERYLHVESTGDPAEVDRSDIAAFLERFETADTADHVRFDRIVDTAVGTVAGFGLLTPVPDTAGRYLVSPAIAPLLPIDKIEALRDALEATALGQAGDPENDSEVDDLDRSDQAGAETHSPYDAGRPHAAPSARAVPTADAALLDEDTWDPDADDGPPPGQDPLIPDAADLERRPGGIPTLHDDHGSPR